jgi:hypothetical protein
MSRKRGRPEDPQAGQALLATIRQLIESVYDTLNGQLDALGMSGSAEPLFHEVQQPLPLLAQIEVAAGQ